MMVLDNEFNIHFNLKKIRRLMKKYGLKCPIRQANPYRRMMKATQEHTTCENIVNRVFKTLVTQGKSGGYYVFVVPVSAELDLKKAAKAAGEKSISMIKQKDLLGLTGYVHGGCSPIGMKKLFPTFIHNSAAEYEKVFVSAGRVGMQVELPLEALKNIVNIKLEDIV